MNTKNHNIDILCEHLNFHYFAGGISPDLGAYREPWTVRPCAHLTQNITGSNKVEFKDDNSIIMQPGDAILLPAGLKHFHSAYNCSSIIYRWSHIQFTILHSIDYLSFFDLPKVFTGETAEHLGDLNNKLSELNNSDESIIAIAAKRKIIGFKILDLILSEVPIKYGLEQHPYQLLRILPALEFIEKNSDKKISVKEMARTCNISEPHFYVIFKNSLNCSPMNYVIKKRINNAQKLFWQGDFTVEEVGVKTGFQDVFYFSKVFKRLLGKPPSSYKKEVKLVINHLTESD